MFMICVSCDVDSGTVRLSVVTASDSASAVKLRDAISEASRGARHTVADSVDTGAATRPQP
jgi:hypothetical protein